MCSPYVAVFLPRYISFYTNFYSFICPPPLPAMVFILSGNILISYNSNVSSEFVTFCCKFLSKVPGRLRIIMSQCMYCFREYYLWF
jgi:hypothetical protein